MPSKPLRVHTPPAEAVQTAEQPHNGPESIPPAALLLTKDDIAALMQISTRQLERWASARIIPGRSQLPGRSVRYNRSAIEEWIRQGCPRPAGKRR
jgi:predicted DNA-binding transcriptional regulator AlpA